MNSAPQCQLYCHCTFRRWTVTNGIDGETCTNWNKNSTELMCDNVNIPACADRTIYCTLPPKPEGATWNILNAPNPSNLGEYLTSLVIYCPDTKHYFDYPVGPNFTSFYYTTNINSISLTCNQDRCVQSVSCVALTLYNSKSINIANPLLLITIVSINCITKLSYDSICYYMIAL